MAELIAPPISIMKEKIRTIILSRLNGLGLNPIDYLIFYIYYKKQVQIQVRLTPQDYINNQEILEYTEQYMKKEFEINLLTDKYGKALLYL